MTLIRNFAENIQSDGDLIITGDLQVDGTTTTVNSTVVDIADKNITLGVGAATNAQNDGAGISILLPDASPDEFATILYTNSSDSWSFNKTVDITGNVSADEVISASIISSSSTNPRLRLFETDTTDLNSQLQSQGGQFLIKTIPDNAATSFIRFMIDHATGDINLGYEDTGASPKLFWDASAESLGIGTDSPSDLMTIQSPAIGGGNGITIKRDDNGTDQRVGGISFGNTVDSDLAQITAQTSTGNNGDGNLLFHTQPNGGVSTERMRITSAGALQLSDVNSPNDINTAIFSNSDVLELEAFGTNGAIAFSTGSGVDERLRITSTGNVGIGTDNPDSNLHIKSTADVKLTLETDEDSNCWINFSGATSEASIGYEPSTNVLKFANASDGVTSNVRMSIDAFGKVGIGNTAPTSNLTIGSAQSDGLEFTFDSTNTYRNRIANYWNSSNDTRMDFEIGPTGNVAPTAIMSVGYGGNVGIGTTAPAGKLNIQYDMDVNTGGVTTLTAGTSQYGSINFSGVTAQSAGASSTTMQGLTWQVNNYAGTTNYGVQAQLVVGNNGSAGTFMGFFTSNNYSNAPVERFRIDESGKVGIGTTSPTTEFEVKNDSPSDNTTIFVHNNSASHAAMFKARGERTGANSDVSQFLTDNSGKTICNIRGVTDTASTSGRLEFWTAASSSNAVVRMTIDEDGNLLVGTTDNNPVNNGTDTSADDGVVLGASGSIAAARFNNTPMFANRTGDNGALIDFRKSGAPVGSIGTDSGFPYIAAPANFSLMLATTDFRPRTVTGASDNDSAVDLGTPDARFKDLFLGGDIGHKDAADNARLLYDKSVNLLGNAGTNVEAYNVIVNNAIQVGGTAAANLLDDYEESDFTATLRGSTAEPATLVTATGYATKVGRIVQYSIGFEGVNTTGYTGNVTITGLPFTNNGGRAIGNTVGYIGLTWSGSDCFSVIGVSATTLEVFTISSNASWGAATHNAGSGRYFWLTGTYMTTA